MALSSLNKLQLIRALLLLVILLDVVGPAVLLLHLGSGENLKETLVDQVIHFNFGVSLFDLWLFSLLRALLFTILVLSFCFNKIKVLRTVKQLATVCTITLVFFFCYTMAKLLSSFEFYEDGVPVRGSNSTDADGNPIYPLILIAKPCVNSSTSPCISVLVPSQRRQPRHPWLWVLIAWSAFSLLFYGFLYYALTKINSHSSLLKSRHLFVHLQSGEETPLIHDQMTSSNDGTNETMKKRLSTTQIMWRIARYTKPFLHLYIFGFFFLIVSSTAMSFIPYYTGQVITHIAIAPSASKFQQAIFIMSGITIISAVAAGLRASILTIADARLGIVVRKVLFKSLLHQEIGFYDMTETGDLTSRLTSDTTKLQDQIGLNLNIFLRNLVTFIGSLVFMIHLTWKLSTITLVGIPVLTMISHIFGNNQKNLAKKRQESYAKANNVPEECLSSMRTVRSFANEEAELKHFDLKLKDTLKIVIRKATIYGAWMSSNTLTELVLQVVTLYYGGHLVINREITGGELVSLLLYQVSLTAALDAMATVLAGLMEAVGAAEKVFELIDRQPEIDHHSGTEKPDKLDGVVEFKNVTFLYPTRPDVQVLKKVSFTVQPGEVVALVGPSGGGKSSCISMLQRYYEPQSGCVLVDGRPLSQYDHTYFHTRISLVGQEPVLYARSVAENISYNLQGATQEAVVHAAKLANAHDFISAMTDGYNTQTGEKGAQLSGGQKQRVAIARALIRDPTVLLLDEATSALDAESEHLVQQALNRNLQGRTVIIIAHRLSTVEKADRIIVINKGEVVEQGSHNDLLKKGGLYAMLVRKQMVADEEKLSCEEEEQSMPLSTDSEIQNEPNDLGRSHSNSTAEQSSMATTPEQGNGIEELHDFLKTPIR